jgi:hypothetical protein
MLLQRAASFMASPNNTKADPPPRLLHVSKSFSRLEPSTTPSPTRSRASTIQNIPEEALDKPDQLGENRKPRGLSDVFARSFGIGERKEERGAEASSGKLPADFDELPIELVSLTDRCVWAEVRGRETCH